jgi:DNA-binding response OmpR family regulator
MPSSSVAVLVADDDDDLRALVAFTLSRAGFTVVTACDGSSAFERLDAEPFKLAVLDVNMPNVDGFAVCSHIRSRSNMPVIMLSARDNDADVVHALELGADDYIKKPFSPATLIARVQALLRRSAEPEIATIEIDGTTLDLERRTLEIAGLRLELTPLEAALLRALFENPGRLVAMDHLATKAWGRAGAPEMHALRQCMHRLRRKLEERLGSSGALETVRGGGYRWTMADRA